jgi:DNA-binding PadR family transcriptional regulator
MGKADAADRPLANTIFHILIALADQPRHGYGIMLDVAERTNQSLKLSPGTLYGAIKQMLADGLIEEVELRAARGDDERRRYYRLTRDGRETARKEMARMSSLLTQARLTSLRTKEG